MDEVKPGPVKDRREHLKGMGDTTGVEQLLKSSKKPDITIATQVMEWQKALAYPKAEFLEFCLPHCFRCSKIWVAKLSALYSMLNCRPNSFKLVAVRPITRDH